jgi:D-alanine-D-alanine ligase-like ATP-grasp enzyme
VPDVPLLGEAAARERAARDEVTTEESGQPEVPSVIPVHTAFIVFQTVDGNTLITPDLNVPFVTTREPSRDEIYGMLATAQKDCVVTEVAGLAAETTVAKVEQKQREAIEAARNAALKQQLERGGLRSTS